MKPSLSKIVQRLDDIEARMNPPPITLIAWASTADELPTVKERTYAAHVKQNPDSRGRPVTWIWCHWMSTDSPPMPKAA